jgi:hypothetical protein
MAECSGGRPWHVEFASTNEAVLLLVLLLPVRHVEDERVAFAEDYQHKGHSLCGVVAPSVSADL